MVAAVGRWEEPAAGALERCGAQKGQISSLAGLRSSTGHPCLSVFTQKKKKKKNGFTTQQAEITVSALVKNMDANMDTVYTDMVTKMQQITVQQIMSQTANVKKQMIILETVSFQPSGQNIRK